MKKNVPNPILRGALIAGMLVLAIFAVIGVTKIVPKAINSIGSAFSSVSSSLFSPKETVVLSLSNNSVKTGEQVNVSFEHKNKNSNGYYEFKFDCADKNLSMIFIDGNVKKNLSCNSTSTVSTNFFKVVPQLGNANSFVDSYLYITFYNNETKKVEATGKTVLTVRNGDTKGVAVQPQTNGTGTVTSTVVSNPNTTTNQNTQNNSTTYNNVVRKSDLYITGKTTGTVVNGVFIPKNVFANGEVSAVRFNIGNDGNIATGPWSFSAVLPTYPAQIFPSGIQPSLQPGQIIEYTLTLQNLAVTGNNIVTINIDPTYSISELSETNNSTVITLVNSGAGYSTGLVIPPYYNGNYSQNGYTGSDLMLRIVSKGYLDRNNGRYYTASSVSQNNRVAMRIEIENIGTGQTGPFVFTADLSGYSEDRYTSPVQTTFYPGEKRQYTVDFNSGVTNSGTNKITVRLDTNNNVLETNENNNVLSEDILVY